MTRKDYYTQIWQYKQRRIEAKKKYETYRNVYRNLTRKLNQWQNEINRIDARKEKLSNILKSVNRYFHVDISKKCVKPEYNIARNIYYKVAIENKIQGKFVSQHIGRSKRTANECRLRFTRGFNAYPENKQLYHRFKSHFDKIKL